MTEQEQSERQRLIAEAMTWLGTPYHFHAKVKGAGADCWTFIKESFIAAGLILPPDHTEYFPGFHLHRGEEIYLDEVKRYCQPQPEGHRPQPGDIVMYRFGRIICHSAIVTSWPEIIHCEPTAGVTLADGNSNIMAPRFCGAFSYWGGDQDV